MVDRERRPTWTVERGQAHTLEGVIASLLLLSSLVYALQVTAVTPLSASTSNQHIENQEQASASGLLATAANKPRPDGDALKVAVLYWDESAGAFHGLSAGPYQNDAGFPSEFTLGRMLQDGFSDRGIAYNVYLHFQTDTGTATERLVYRGAPSDNAVSASRTVTLYNDDELYEADESLDTGTTVGDEDSDFYAPDVDSSSAVYNVVRVEVVVWRM
ncbi:DUF7288 family protein [Haloglomus litoreum]|uniref:DUF7288 family protein n=1 Tax=Haloglomus litoreum TaxID=3034026 RepID=UPI0023E82A56|nr:hypothetical protein [Haloglomus sp. DT116]